MQNTDELFLLVQSLSKAERRFFRLYAEGIGGKGEKSYLQLFEIICAQRPYDEQKLRDRIQAKSLQSGLSTIKNRLFNHILRSQRLLKAGQTRDSRLRQLLEEVELLYFQRLFKSAEKRIRQGLALAREAEKHTYALEFLHWKQQLLTQKKLSEQVEALMDIRDMATAQLQALDRAESYAHLHTHMRILARLQPRGRGSESLAPHTAILAEPILQQLPADATPLDRIHFLDTHGIYHVCNGNYPEALATFQQLMAAWEAHSDYILVYPELYLRCYNNYLGALLYGEQHWEEFEAAVRRLHVLPGLPHPVRINFQWVAYHQELVFSMHFRTFHATSALIGEIESWIQANESKIEIPRRLAFFYNIAMFFFVYGEFSASNRWLTRILQTPGTTERKDIREFARVFQVVLQYELGHHDLIDNLVRAALRQMNRARQRAGLERSLLDLIAKLAATPSGSARLALLRNFKSAMEAFQQGKTQRAMLGMGELQVWVASKLDQQPIRAFFEELLQSNRAAAKMKG